MSEGYDKPPPYSPAAPPTYNESADPKSQMYAPAPPPSAHIPPQYAPTYPVNTAPMQGYGSTTYIQAPPSVPGQVIVIGGCPVCRVGILEDDFTVCGVLCAILFFPLGILCCLAMRQRRCPNCSAVFG